MEPLSPNDPLWKLLGEAKRVKVRGNFLQDVVREARQTPQERGVWARVAAWFERMNSAGSQVAVAGAAVAVVALVATVLVVREPMGREVAQAPVATATVAAEVDIIPASDAQWADMEQFDSLLAVSDASELTDGEIYRLLY